MENSSIFAERRSFAPIIIAGSGRSGTTWILDALAEANQLRSIFEPLNPQGVKAAAAFAYTYIREDIKDQARQHFIEKVLTGNIHGLWVDYRYLLEMFHVPLASLTDPQIIYRFFVRCMRLWKHYKTYRRQVKHRGVIVKFIRANLMLGWLARTFETKIIYVVRHPGAVVESQMRVWGKTQPTWVNTVLQIYRRDRQLYEVLPSTAQDLVNKPLSSVARYTVVWCIENYLLLKHDQQHGYYTIFYEHLVANLQVEWQRIIDWAGLKNLPDSESLGQPSQQVSPQNRKSTFNESGLTRWRRHFNQEQLHEMDVILRAFGIHAYTMDDPMSVMMRKAAHE